ncbi:MAG: MFS transporter [Anaerolineae bacterium]|nr:MFS transporter [Anaerolineae bacterium]
MRNRFPALQYRDFRIFITTQLFSLVGSWMQVTILPFLAYRLTNQPIYLGAIGFASTIPSLLVMLPAGVVIERMDKRRAVLVLQFLLMIQAAILGILTIMGDITIWHMLVLVSILGFVNAFEVTARQSMFVELVSKETLANAIGINSTIFNMARVVGPAVSAPLVIFLKGNDIGWVFIINAISYLIVIAGLAKIQNRQPQKSPHPSRIDFSELIEGQKYVWTSPSISLLIIAIAVPAFFGFSFTQFVPAYAEEILLPLSKTSADSAALNSYMITFQGIGALIAAIAIALFSTTQRKTSWLIVGQFAFSLGLILISLSRSISVSLGSALVLGWGWVTQLSLTNTIVQLNSPDELRGRVISSYLWVLQSIAPFGSLFMGFLAERFGISATLMICGICCTLGFAIFHISNPKLRQMRI